MWLYNLLPQKNRSNLTLTKWQIQPKVLLSAELWKVTRKALEIYVLYTSTMQPCLYLHLVNNIGLWKFAMSELPLMHSRVDHRSWETGNLQCTSIVSVLRITNCNFVLKLKQLKTALSFLSTGHACSISIKNKVVAYSLVELSAYYLRIENMYCVSFGL